MKQLLSLTLAMLVTTALPGGAAADDTYQVRGTPQEQHAERIFTGVFGQCRPTKADAVEGVVALVFEVDSSGKFGATATFKEAEGRDELRSLVQCMGARANQARHFPEASSDQMIGVKFVVESKDGLIKLGKGESETLKTGEMFRWARQTPSA